MVEKNLSILSKDKLIYSLKRWKSKHTYIYTYIYTYIHVDIYIIYYNHIETQFLFEKKEWLVNKSLNRYYYYIYNHIFGSIEKSLVFHTQDLEFKPRL